MTSNAGISHDDGIADGGWNRRSAFEVAINSNSNCDIVRIRSINKGKKRTRTSSSVTSNLSQRPGKVRLDYACGWRRRHTSSIPNEEGIPMRKERGRDRLMLDSAGNCLVRVY